MKNILNKLIDTKNMIKSIIYRVYSSIVTFLIVLLITGNFQLSFTVSVIENVFKVLTYYWFDIVWYKLTKKKYRTSILWFTGLSSSGKTTIAKKVLAKLKKEGHIAMLLDGDEIRDIFKNYGFDKAARIKHNQDVGKMAVYLQSQGIIPVVSLISPYAEARNYVRSISDDFTEIYINTPLSICEKRDTKGLYAKARSGEIKDFTGIHSSSPYEPPTNPEIIIDTNKKNINECTKQIIDFLCQKN